ncbi:hypothetical protein NL108_002309 [Boleophthalmus pectinirostris]|nr:hypothetical protein NL108_002309 [Boleophthalmus pectinirostris]
MDSGSHYVSKLNEYTQKMGMKPPVYEDLGSSGPDHMKIFTQGVRLEGKIFPDGSGNSKKVAKHNAAKNAYKILMGLQEEPASVENSGRDVNYPSRGTGDVNELCEKTNDLNVSKYDTSSTNKTDFVSMVNIYCQKTRRIIKYIEETPEAQSQKPFAYRMEIDEQRYPVGTGMNKREAKQMAAQLAWSALQKQPDWDSKVSVGSAMSQDEESEMSSTSATGSNLLEPDFSSQSAQSSSGGSWIQFKQTSKSSSVQDDSSGQKTGLEKKNKNGLTTRTSRFTSEYGCIERLGSGSYGCVYKAKNLVLEKYRAIKEIQSRDIQKSLQEVKVLSELLHENIVRYYTCWFEDTGYGCQVVRPNLKFLFVEMELCDGGTLRRWIYRKNKAAEENSRQKESLDIAGQILSGVEYIHSKKLIHRDLKPENIFFGHDGKVRIGDFGLVTQDNNDGEIVERTEEQGTRNYMAPEQFGANYDRKVDIWALGLILFELFWRISTGHERVAIWREVRKQDLPKEFTRTYSIESRIIKIMLSEKPEDRPEASALKSELDKWTRASEEDINQKTV